MSKIDSCCICSTVFNKDKRYQRSTLTAQVKTLKVSAGYILRNDLGLSITPNKLPPVSICNVCSLALGKISTGKEQVKSARTSLFSSASGCQYIGKKMARCPPSPFTPRSAKKRRLVTSTPLKHYKEAKTTLKHKEAKTLFGLKGNLSRAAHLIARSNHYTSLRLLMRTSSSFRRAFLKILQVTITKEVNLLCSPATSSTWRSTVRNVQTFTDFNWDTLLQEASENCPTLLATLTAAGTTHKQRQSLHSGKKVKISLKPNIGAILGQIVFMRKPRKMKLLQEMFGVQLWLSGCARDAFTRFNNIGISLGIKAVTRCIDGLRHECDKDLQTLKVELSSTISAKRQLCLGDQASKSKDHNDSDSEPCELNNSLAQPLLDDSLMELDDASDQLDETVPYSSSKDSKRRGYSLVFDNVNQKTYARYSTRERGNTMLNMVQAYAAVDRVPCLHFDDSLPTPEAIKVIPMHTFFPNESDIQTLRYEYNVITKRILCNAMPFFNDLYENVTHHITHEYSEESHKKSKLIPLGVLNKDESRIADMVDIMEAYHKYVPGTPGETAPMTTILYGDGLSCERANDAQNARLNSDNPWDRLEGLNPAIQEWHKRGLLLEDTFKLLYDVRSSRAVGTMYFIRNKYRHHNVKGKVLHCFNHATDLTRFTTEAYIIAAACEYMAIEDPSNPPPNLPSDAEMKWNYFTDVCESVVQHAFHPTIIPAKKGQEQHFCICQEDSLEEMISCDNNECPHGLWFHLSCVNLNVDNVPEGNWFCSKHCTYMANPKNKKVKSRHTDHIYEYSKAILHNGLGEMARHDAIRENDGNRMISHWRLDMPHFYSNNHPKYFVQGHRLLTDLNGGASSRIAMQLKWNRTVNARGGKGKNVEMDLQMEFFNREYKEAIKCAGGNLTADSIDRYSQMVGIKKSMNSIFDHKVTYSSTFHRNTGTVPKKRHDDIIDLVKRLVRNQCLKYIPGRQHCGFENFELDPNFRYVNGMEKRITKLLKKRAKRIEMATD